MIDLMSVKTSAFSKLTARWSFAVTCIAVIVVMMNAVACGGAGSDDESSGEVVDDTANRSVASVPDEKALNTIGERPEISAWTRPNSDFSYEQFIEAGWKQHQIYDVDTLPQATDARYGFYNRKDVEIRRYPSHSDAMDVGTASAEEAIKRVVHDGSGFSSRRVYGGYLVVGNLVMMCEISTSDCVDLIEATEALDTQ